jgi:hypothetical protein
VQKLLIEASGQPPIRLQNHRGQWQMLSPFKMPANNGRIQQLLQITQAKSQAQYPISDVDAKQVKLDAPMLSLTIDNVVMRFGTTTALGSSRYVQVGNTVHLITDRYSYLARVAATDFVSPRLLPEGSQISDLQLPRVHLTEKDGVWEQQGVRVDGAAMQALLTEWQQARALQVSTINKAETATEAIQLTLDNAQKQVLHFSLLRSDDEIILQRAELGIQYHFPKEMGQRLLSLPAPAATEKQPANTPNKKPNNQ